MKPHPATNHAAYLEKWQLSAPVFLSDTPTGLVWKVQQHNGDPAVLKLLKPRGLPQEVHGADFLEWRNGRGCARLLKRDETVFLIEYISDYTLRDHLLATSDREATSIICDVIDQIHSNHIPDTLTGLPNLEDHCRALFRAASREAKKGSPGLTSKAAKVLSDLLPVQKEVQPLHGDIHHRNIMLSPTRDWLAIDPGSLIADPVFDVANVFFNPDDMETMVEDLTRIRYLAKTFANLLDRPVKTILQYGFVYACLSASWAKEDGHDPTSRLAAAQLMYRELYRPN